MCVCVDVCVCNHGCLHAIHLVPERCRHSTFAAAHSQLCVRLYSTRAIYVLGSQIPLANGSLGVFSSTLSAVEKAVLIALESLGFDRVATVDAVTHVMSQHSGRALSADDLQSAAVQFILDSSPASHGAAAASVTVRVCCLVPVWTCVMLFRVQSLM
jgi:hypothetical protein